MPSGNLLSHSRVNTAHKQKSTSFKHLDRMPETGLSFHCNQWRSLVSLKARKRENPKPSTQAHTMNTLTLINGNGRPFNIGLPKLFMLGKINDVALAHVKENTGLDFIEKHGGYEAQPETGDQITALFLTYNFKTRYYNNCGTKNTLFLKSDHHIGFQVDSICMDCIKHNHITTNMTEGRLAC